MTKPTGIWATENWCPRIPRGLFFVILGPIAVGFAVLQAFKLKAITCVRFSEASGDFAFEPKLVTTAVGFLVVFLALGRAHDVAEELRFLRFFRQSYLSHGGSDATFVSCIFGMGLAYILPMFSFALWAAFHCPGVEGYLQIASVVAISSLFVVLFLILPLRFLSRPSGPDPRQPPSGHS